MRAENLLVLDELPVLEEVVDVGHSGLVEVGLVVVERAAKQEPILAVKAAAGGKVRAVAVAQVPSMNVGALASCTVRYWYEHLRTYFPTRCVSYPNSLRYSGSNFLSSVRPFGVSTSITQN